MDFIRLPLEGVDNARDLGGYCTKNRQVTKFKVFVRSSRLTDLTENDNEFLKEYGITDIIDLRGLTQIQSTFVSDDNINKDYFKFHYLPLSTEEMEKYCKDYLMDENFDFGEAYKYLLDNKIKVKEIFKVLANAEGGVLFHCTAGKDRTGVVSALLLGLCDVPEKDIIANYEVTNTYIKESEFLNTYPGIIQESYPHYMKTFLNRLKEKYGTAEKYLLSCDISKEELDRIKNKFCENM